MNDSASTEDPKEHLHAIIGALGVPTAVIIGGVLAVLLALNVIFPPSQAGKAPAMQETPEVGSHVVAQ